MAGHQDGRHPGSSVVFRVLDFQVELIGLAKMSTYGFMAGLGSPIYWYSIVEIDIVGERANQINHNIILRNHIGYHHHLWQSKRAG